MTLVKRGLDELLVKSQDTISLCWPLCQLSRNPGNACSNLSGSLTLTETESKPEIGSLGNLCRRRIETTERISRNTFRDSFVEITIPVNVDYNHAALSLQRIENINRFLRDYITLSLDGL